VWLGHRRPTASAIAESSFWALSERPHLPPIPNRKSAHCRASANKSNHSPLPSSYLKPFGSICGLSSYAEKVPEKRKSFSGLQPKTGRNSTVPGLHQEGMVETILSREGCPCALKDFLNGDQICSRTWSMFSRVKGYGRGFYYASGGG